jgi:(E)-4-hydroxy-3-methylbut-2-enyl-diphosphate synthase
MHNKEGLKRVYQAAASSGVKVRIGVNSGSIRPRDGLDVRRDGVSGDLAALMVERALEYCRDAEKEGLGNIVLSLKASDVPTTIAAYRIAAWQCDYPFHLGVTAAGPPQSSIIKSAIGIGTLLAEGIGDTIRVSMTAPPDEEVTAGLDILEALGLRPARGPEIISCPTCARCQIDLRRLVQDVASRVRNAPAGMKIAVMGCIVNGPGEAAEADVGLAGGRDFGYIFRQGKKICKVAAGELANALVDEVGRASAIQHEGDPRAHD